MYIYFFKTYYIQHVLFLFQNFLLYTKYIIKYRHNIYLAWDLKLNSSLFIHEKPNKYIIKYILKS